MRKKIIFNLFVIIINILLLKPLKGETEFDSTGGYAKKEIVFLKWGNGDKEVGLKEDDIDNRTDKSEISRATPEGIKIDGKGNIYFEDVIKWNVVKYDPKNKTIEKCESNGGYLKYLVDNEQEGLYIFNSKDNSVDIILSGKNRIKKYDSHITENLLNTVIRINNKILSSEGKKKINFDETDTSYLWLKEEKTSPEYDFNAKNPVIKFRIIEPLYTYFFYDLKKIDAVCDEIIYKTVFSSEYHGFINIDKDKNIYYLFGKSPTRQDNPIEYFVVKINPALCGIDIIFLEIDNFAGYLSAPVEHVAVDINGNIYQLLNKEDGVHVLCWSK